MGLFISRKWSCGQLGLLLADSNKAFEDMMAVMKVRRRYLLVRGAKSPVPVARWTLGTTSRFYFARRPQKLLSFFTSLSLMSPIDHLKIC